MEPKVQVFGVPKLGNTEEEYEDASAYSLAARRFAIADGATESSFADRWAQSLVRHYTTSPPLTPPASVPLPEWLVPLQQTWHASIRWDRLPWFAEEKARAGAFATLLGLHFVGGDQVPSRWSLLNWLRRRRVGAGRLRWHALAVGDSCLFQVRDDRLQRAFPLDRAAAFNDRPVLLSSNPLRNQAVWKAVRFAEGDCRPNDLFFLLTDALAKWFLQECEADRRPWGTLAALRTQPEFGAWVNQARQDGALRNDDTTLVLLRSPETLTEAPGPASRPRP